MTTAIAPEKSSTPYSLASPPPGASFEYAEVKGDRGQKSFGKVPLLTWNEDQSGVDGMLAFYGPAGVAQIANGTSVRVTAQSIARRGKAKLKSDEDIAKEQLEYRPGTRQGGTSTPASRAAAAAKKASDKLNGDGLALLLSKIASGEITSDQLSALGIDASALAAPADDETDDEENDEENEDTQ